MGQGLQVGGTGVFRQARGRCRRDAEGAEGTGTARPGGWHRGWLQKGQALRDRVGGTETGGTEIGAVAVRMPGGSVRVAIWKRTAVSQPARVNLARANLPVSNLPAQATAGDSGDGVGCFSLRIIWRD